MKDTEFNKQLLEKFPNLKEKFDKEFPYEDKMETGKHVTIEQVWWPFFLEAIRKNNKDLITKFCQYVDELMALGEDCQNVVYVSIIENLASEKIDITKLPFKPEYMKLYVDYYNNF